jgi:hypothetical protein
MMFAKHSSHRGRNVTLLKENKEAGFLACPEVLKRRALTGISRGTLTTFSRIRKVSAQTE